MAPLRVIHYVNQFFGGIGGEDKGDMRPIHHPGPVGPGIALGNWLGSGAAIVGTLICGDSYAVEHPDETIGELIHLLQPYEPDVLVAGPAFSSGRYGTACGTFAQAFQQQIGKPAVAAMDENNPGVELFRSHVYIVRTGPTAAAMSEALRKMATLALKLGRGIEIGSADEEGYFPRGIRKNLRVDASAGERAVEMLLAKMAGRAYRTELPIEEFGSASPAPPVPDLSRALVGLVTESGLVPFGNPDRLETWNASRWFKYPIAGLDDLEPGKYHAWHGGCDTTRTNEDPDRAVPLDAARQLEKEGVIDRIYDYYYVTTGNMANIKTMARIGAEIAHDLKANGVQAVILTAT
jgi:glycine reductase